MALADTFNRADSSTSVGTASDGGTWTVDNASSTVFGIKSNAMYLVSGGSISDRVRRNLGSVAVDASITTIAVGSSRMILTYAYDPATQNGYYLAFDGQVHKWTSGGAATVGSLPSPAFNSPTSGRVMRVVYDPTSGNHSVYWDGVLKGTVNDSTPWTGVNNTWVGLGATDIYSNIGETLDNFSASAATIVRPLWRPSVRSRAVTRASVI